MEATVLQLTIEERRIESKKQQRKVNQGPHVCAERSKARNHSSSLSAQISPRWGFPVKEAAQSGSL
ncbi:hypothetical protein K0M31_005051 [Melipona bicolor]|uniref:Uncharacterized protein n=1 Tax=Melipona bicolor TaxID=60889 RepID=A0AA40KN10_9HYME|nr:hypothetical protein K0M31_005051 [Melipona bicolor]